MVAYTIINGTAAALATSPVTTAAYTIETGVTLTNAELAAITALNGVATMQDAPTAAEKNGVANLILQYTAGVAPPAALQTAISFYVINGSANDLTDINAAGDDVPAGTSLIASLTPAEAAILAATASVLLLKASTTQEQRRYAARVLHAGSDPAVKTA